MCREHISVRKELALQQLQCVDKGQCKIQWLQTIYNEKWTSTQKQIPRENEKFDLLSANKFLYSMCKYRGLFFDITSTNIGALFNTTYCTHEVSQSVRCFGAHFWEFASGRGVTRGARANNVPGADSLGGAEKSQQSRKYFLQYSTLLQKDLTVEHGGGKLVSCPGAI